jgi:hypothetical protein
VNGHIIFFNAVAAPNSKLYVDFLCRTTRASWKTRSAVVVVVGAVAAHTSFSVALFRVKKVN